jgi:propionate CoA-transferase
MKVGHPKNLTVMASAGQGDGSGERGLDIIAHEGLIGRLIFTHCGLLPGISKLITENKLLAYCFPQGVLAQLYRDIAANRPGLLTHVGLHTYVDPRYEGAKANEFTLKNGEDLVDVMNVNLKDYLFYKSVPVNVAFIRATTADEKGNLSTEREGMSLEILSMAQAAKSHGGIVVAQVERLAKANSVPVRLVKVPHILVDYVVVADPENHWQTFAERYNPAVSGEITIPFESIERKPLDSRKIIGRRGLLEIRPSDTVNLGIGMPEAVSFAAAEERVSTLFTLTVESGIIGGVPLGGASFGVGVNYDAMIDHSTIFDFYDGKGLDIAFLGFAQVGEDGSVNVSKFGGRFVGCGGFINITQNSKSVIFCGTLTASNLDERVENGELKILKEGKTRKFVKKVDQITFNGEYEGSLGKRVVYVTERCVFELKGKGILLTEIAPGVDLDRDILAQMDFKPLIEKELKTMDRRIFKNEPMGLKGSLE